MGALGSLVGFGCLLGLLVAPVVAILVYRNQRRARALAWQIIRQGRGLPQDIDACIAALSGGEDAESVELVRRLMELKKAALD